MTGLDNTETNSFFDMNFPFFFIYFSRCGRLKYDVCIIVKGGGGGGWVPGTRDLKNKLVVELIFEK